MKILQLIDTLHPGGAERIAVNYVNSLLKYNIDSQICVTREKGILIEDLNIGVKIHFLNKQSLFDLSAFYKLVKIIKDNNIDIVHAHGASWFFAVLCKFSGAKFKLIWHDHYGNSEFLDNRTIQPIKFFSRKFDGIISVNLKLKDWAQNKLNCSNIIFLNNFIRIQQLEINEEFTLKGDADFNLICVANLRPQKDHHTLIEAFKAIDKEKKVSLHLFGKNYEDKYSLDLIELFKSTASVFWYGGEKKINSYLARADIGILSSLSEGLPLALLEYGSAGLGVICTDVGECRNVIDRYGILVRPGKPPELTRAMNTYIQNHESLRENAIGLKKRINQLYSEEYVIPNYLTFCNALC